MMRCRFAIKQLAEDMARYLYLPRVRDDDVLLAAIREGLERLTWKDETFAYAESWDEARHRYVGLKAGQSLRVLLDAQSVLVKPEVADNQFQRDAEQQQAAATAARTSGQGPTSPGGTTPLTPFPGGGASPAPAVDVTTPVPQLRRFHGSVRINPLRLGRDAAQIAEEVVQHLSKIVGAQVEITLEISAELPEGASEKLVRDVTENCRTLRFDGYSFEES